MTIENEYENYILIDAIDKIKQIKCILKNDSNEIFYCFDGTYNLCGYGQTYNCIESNKNNYNQCFNYNLEKKNISNALIYYYPYCNNFENIFIKENDDYIIICNNENIKIINAYKMKGNNINEIKYNYFKFDKCDEIYNISLIYNNSNKQYDIITDCYDYNEIWNIIYISSVFTDNIDYYTQYSLITSKPLLIKSLISSTNPLSIQSSIYQTNQYQ